MINWNSQQQIKLASISLRNYFFILQNIYDRRKTSWQAYLIKNKQDDPTIFTEKLLFNHNFKTFIVYC